MPGLFLCLGCVISQYQGEFSAGREPPVHVHYGDQYALSRPGLSCISTWGMGRNRSPGLS